MIRVGCPKVMKEFYSLKIRQIVNYFFHERWSFIFLCLYLMTEYVRPQTIYPLIDILPYAQVSILLALIATLLEGRGKSYPNEVNKLMLALSFLIILSSMLAYRPEVSFDHWIDFTQWLIIYFLIVRIVSNEKRFFFFMLLFLLFSFKMSQHGFLSWASKGFGWDSWGVTGSPGWFHNSGEFGIQLCIYIPLSIYFIIALKKYWGKFLFGFFLLMPITGVGSVIASSSRGAVVGLAAAILWMLLKSQHKIKTIIVVFIVGIILVAYTPEESKERFERSGNDPTSVMRMNRWVDGIDMMNTHPVLGIGYGNWMVYYPRHYYRPEIGNLGAYGLSHNIFIQAGSELGYTGLILYIMLIIYSFINNYRTRKMAQKLGNNYVYYMAHGLDAALVGFLVSASFVTVMYYPYFWINLAFVVSLNNIIRLEDKEAKNKDHDAEDLKADAVTRDSAKVELS